MRQRAVPLRPVPEPVLLVRIVFRGRFAQAARNRQLRHIANCVALHSAPPRSGLAPIPAVHSSHPITRWPMGPVFVRLISFPYSSFRRSDRPPVDRRVHPVITACLVRIAVGCHSRSAASRSCPCRIVDRSSCVPVPRCTLCALAIRQWIRTTKHVNCPAPGAILLQPPSPRPRRDIVPLDPDLPRFLEQVHELRPYVSTRAELGCEEGDLPVGAVRRGEPGVVRTRSAAQ